MYYDEIRKNPTVNAFIQQADDSLRALGYTEHSFAHVTIVAETAGHILETLDFPEKTIDLVKTAGYLHDIGNLINRVDHSQSGALLAYQILKDLDYPAEDIAQIICAIGNHDEGCGVPVSPMAAALIIADKGDVRRNRVRNIDFNTFDIHDQVNYSVTESKLEININKQEISLILLLDTDFSPVMNFFDIFLTRMKLCHKAAETLGLRFRLNINGQNLL